jgi:hypothetical protein
MLIQNETPFTAHVFVCNNDRGGERKPFADNEIVTVMRYLDEW